MEYQVNTYYTKEDLPYLEDKNFFHFSSSFDWYKNISFYKPVMFVVSKESFPVAAMSALIMRINRFLHGSFFKRCYISQQPAFFDKKVDKIHIFDLLISALLKEVSSKVFFIEYRNLGDAVFGYKGFRENGFYSVKWINVCNSLQKKRKVWDQLSATRKNQFNKAARKGVTVEEITTQEKLIELYKVIDKSNRWKISNRFLPFEYYLNFLNYYVKEKKGVILTTRYKGKIIGGIILGFEKRKVNVLYYWGKEKSHKTLYPSVFTIYKSMKWAESEGFEYFDFMDSGYIDTRAGKPRFLLQFGGKPRASRRWYRFNWKLFNFFARKIYE